MRVIHDKNFAGEEGMVRVWNKTPGFVQVTEEGHLLQSMTSAWVDDNPAVQYLIEEGMVAVLSGSSKKSAKKNTKTKAKQEALSQSDTSQDQVVAQVSEESSNEQPVVEKNQEEATEEVVQTLDSMILDSSELSDSADSVSVENI